MKKFIYALMLLLLLICLFSACDGGKEHEHTFGEWEAKSASTCTQMGEEKRTCLCGEEEIRNIPMLEHSYGEWSTTISANCGNNGEEKHTCYCGASETRSIPATGEHVSTPSCKCEVCDQKVAYHREDSIIYFGEYPQTKKSEGVTITATTDDRGYYLGSDNAYYAKVVADPYYDSYTFADETAVVEGQEYFFKVEPIRWQVLSEIDGTVLIICENAIANHAFDDNSNNYADSQIRAWLNDQFYHTAFSDLEQELILATSVDNSAESTCYPNNPYACEDTEDKIFLLSAREYMGFMETLGEDFLDKDLMDYGFASGGYAFDRNSYWWLRSAMPDRGVNWGICVGDPAEVNNIGGGVVPALQVRLS